MTHFMMNVVIFIGTVYLMARPNLFLSPRTMISYLKFIVCSLCVLFFVFTTILQSKSQNKTESNVDSYIRDTLFRIRSVCQIY